MVLASFNRIRYEITHIHQRYMIEIEMYPTEGFLEIGARLSAKAILVPPVPGIDRHLR